MTRNKGIWYSVKNQVAWFARWATWSWSNWDKSQKTTWCHSCLMHLPRGKNLWMWRLSPTRWRRHKQNQSQMPSFDSAVLSCTSESFRRKEARRNAVARRPLESNGRQERSTEKQRPSLDLEQVAERRAIQNFPVGDRLDRNQLVVLGQPRDDRHLPPRALSPEESVREQYHNEMSGPMRMREDYQATTKVLLSLREEQRRTNNYLPTV